MSFIKCTRLWLKSFSLGRNQCAGRNEKAKSSSAALQKTALRFADTAILVGTIMSHRRNDETVFDFNAIVENIRLK